MKRRGSIVILMTTLAAAATALAHPHGDGKDEEYASWSQRPRERFGDARRAFDEVREQLLKRYYKENLTEEDLYRAAVQGMLQSADPPMRRWNKLLSPTEMTELRGDIKGEVVGIGVDMAFDAASGIADVNGVLPGSPSEKAGIRAGDKLLSVNGKLYKGLQARDMIYDIRGKPGEAVTLNLLRGAEVLTLKVVRDRLTYESVTHAVLGGDIGYVGVRLFAESTVALLREALDRMATAKVRALVVDLRGNQGGLFQEAVASAELLLPRGTEIVRMVGRGGSEQRFVAKGTQRLPGVPVVVLMDNQTSSGAEFVAASLQEGLRAPLVGSHSFGKWSVQTLDELPNHYTYKFTTALFRTPSGKTYEGEGLIPDIEVELDARTVPRLQRLPVEKRLSSDPQLRAAVNLLTRR